jgi:anti-anti-sigma factor
MHITIKEQKLISTVMIAGPVTQDDTATLRNRLSDAMDSGKIKLIVDLQEIPYLSSKFLAALIDTKNSVISRGGDLKLANANIMIKNLFEMTRLNAKIEIFESEEDARKSFL